MKILIAANIYPPDSGGPALHAKKQWEWFNQQGVETGVVALAHFRKWPKFLRHWIYLFSLVIKALGKDVIYAHDAVGSGLPAAMAAKFLGKKLVIRIGGDLAWDRSEDASKLSLVEWYESGAHLKNRFYKLSLWPLKQADRIVVPTGVLASIYEKYYEVESSRLVVIPNPMPDVPHKLIRQEQKIVFASRLVAYKNLDLVLKVLAKVFPTHADLKFVVMGDGPERGKLERLVSDLHISPQVVFEGQVSQDKVLEETSSSLFTLAPAVMEFNPNYVLQGLAYGKPFLVSRGHGFPFSTPEMLTFDHGDEKDLESKVNHLLTPEGYEEAKKFVNSLNFKVTWEDNLKANLETLRQVIIEK
jgi:glycosyltransferase involved in cell wall biosynthesis